MSAMPSSGVFQAKRQRELRGPNRSDGEESAATGQQGIESKRLASPQRLEPKYTEPERTSSSSFKPPMSREALKRAKLPDPPEPQQSSLSSALSFFKHVFTGRSTLQSNPTVSSSSNSTAKAHGIKLIEKSTGATKASPTAPEKNENKTKANESDKEKTDKDESDLEIPSSNPNVLEEQQDAATNLKKENKVEKSRKSKVPFSYDPKKLRPVSNVIDVMDNGETNYPQPTILPSQPTDCPMDRQWDARMRKIEQFKRRHLILQPTVIEPETFEHTITTHQVKSQYVDNNLKPEYIFPPREIKPRLSTLNKSPTPAVRATPNSKWYNEESRDVNQILDRKQPYSTTLQTQGRRSPAMLDQKSVTRKYALIPPLESNVPIIQKSESGGTTSFRASTSPVSIIPQRHSTSSAKRSSTALDKRQSPPKIPENRWQKNSPASRQEMTQKSRIRSKSTPDRSFFTSRSEHTTTGLKSVGRVKSNETSKETRSQTSMIDDRDVPMIYANITPKTNPRTPRSKKSAVSKSTMSSRINTPITQQSKSPIRQPKTNDAQSPASGRRLFNSPQSQTSARRSSSPAPVSTPSDHRANSSYSRSPAMKSPTHQSPAATRRPMSSDPRSPAAARRSVSNQQSPSSYHNSPRRPSWRPSSPWRPKTPAHQSINSRSSFKTSPSNRHVNKKTTNAGHRSGFPQKGSPLRSKSTQSQRDSYSISSRDEQDFDHSTRQKSMKQSASLKTQHSNKHSSKSPTSSWSNHSNKHHTQPAWIAKNQHPPKLNSQSKASKQSSWIQKNLHHKRPNGKSNVSSRSQHINNDVVQSAKALKNQYREQSGQFDPFPGLQTPELQLVEPATKEQVMKSPTFSSHENKSPMVLPTQFDNTPHFQSSPLPTQHPPSLSGSGQAILTSPSRLLLPAHPAASEIVSPDPPLDRFEAMSVSPITLEALNYKSHPGQPLPPHVSYTKGSYRLDETDDVNDDYASDVPKDSVHHKENLNGHESIAIEEHSLKQDDMHTNMTHLNKDEGLDITSKGQNNNNCHSIEQDQSNLASSNVTCQKVPVSATVYNSIFETPIVDYLEMEHEGDMDCSNSSIYGAPTSVKDDTHLFGDMLQEPTSASSIYGEQRASDDMHATAGKSSQAQLKVLQSQYSKTLKASTRNPEKLNENQPNTGLQIKESKGIVAAAAPISLSQVAHRNGYRKNETNVNGRTIKNKNKHDTNHDVARNPYRGNGEDEACSTCSPLASKVPNTALKFDQNHIAQGLKDVKKVTPLVNRKVNKARRQSLQSIVQSRSPPTTSSPLQYRKGGERSQAHQRPLSWGKNAAVITAASAGAKMGEFERSRNVSTQRNTLQQSESSTLIGQGVSTEKPASSGSVMKKTISFFSSFFHDKENTLEKPSIVIDDKVIIREEKNEITARPEYSNNGAKHSTFQESLKKNRSLSPWQIPQSQDHALQQNKQKVVVTSDSAIEKSESDDDFSGYTDRVKRSYASRGTRHPGHFASAATKRGEIP